MVLEKTLTGGGRLFCGSRGPSPHGSGLYPQTGLGGGGHRITLHAQICINVTYGTDSCKVMRKVKVVTAVDF